ncbi:stage V sporulation protein D [bacterium BMS3Bbin04]|nr:stage V sporulation protein D [bacterium BMS3Bbin04]
MDSGETCTLIDRTKGTVRFDPNRLNALILISVLLCLVLIFRLARLQLVHSDLYLRQSQTNRVRVLEEPPLRGLMLDRHGNLLVDNYPSYTLMGVPRVIRQNPGTRDTLLAITGLDSVEFEKRLDKIKGNWYTPVRLLRDVSFEMMATIEERRARIPGVHFRVEVKRAYPNPVTSHTLGHIGELKKERVSEYPGFQEGDVVGLAGLEQRWNPLLTGQRGYEYLEVDAKGRIIGPVAGMESQPPTPGSDLILSLDLELQQLAETLLDSASGSVVAIEPSTGEVLVLASVPDYPPETFANALSPQEWKALQDDPRKPLLHRAIQGMYPPGSTFKMAMLSSGLQSGTIDTDWTVVCNGGYQLGRRFFRCWKHAGHGEVDQRLSIESSCDVFYYLLGRKMGIDTFHEYISRWPFGSVTGIDLPHEKAGLLPSRESLDRQYGGGWTDGHLFNIAIGQGDVLATPLQLATFAAALANGGWWIDPHLVKQVKTGDEYFPPDLPLERHETGFSAEVMRIVRDDMLAVTEGSRGTAHWLHDPRLQVAGKTGTSQNPHGEDHALFVAFAPFEDPQIAVAVVVEHGKHGSTAAAPIAYKLIRKYLGLDEETWQQYRWTVLREAANRQAAAEREQAVQDSLENQE